MKQSVRMEELLPIMEEQLNQGVKVAFTPYGISMRPMLEHGRDQVYLEKVTKETVRRRDVVFYRTPGGQFVLHRIVKLTPDVFVTRGDHHCYNDMPQHYETLIGRVCRFERKGSQHQVHDLSYRTYVTFWLGTYPVRWLFHKCGHGLKLLIQRIV